MTEEDNAENQCFDDWEPLLMLWKLMILINMLSRECNQDGGCARAWFVSHQCVLYVVKIWV